MADMHKRTEAPVSQESPSRYLDKIVIRVPDGLRDRIAAAAKKNRRSVNSELVELLELNYPEDTPTPDLLKLAKEIIGDIENSPNEELSDGFRAYLVAMLDEAFEHGVFKGGALVSDNKWRGTLVNHDNPFALPRKQSQKQGDDTTE